MSRIAITAALMSGMILAPTAAKAAEDRPAAQATRSEALGVGATIPDVAVLDEQGGEVRLRDLVRRGPTVLLFYRGGWCPYCNLHLKDVAGVEKELLASGVQIHAISTDQPSKLRETPERDSLGYSLLSDSRMEAARAFGIAFEVPAETVRKYRDEFSIDLEAASGQTHHLLPHPSVFVVDATGQVRFAHVDPDYKVRLDARKIVEAAHAAFPPADAKPDAR